MVNIQAALVKQANGRRKHIKASRLTPVGEQTELTWLVKEVVERARNKR